MSRLLFAAARGARTQALVNVASPCQCVNCGAINKFGCEGRVDFDVDMAMAIHPDDEYLQYGPISSALRTEAEDWTGGASWYLEPFIYAELNSTAWHHCREADELTRSLFLLILAEALADEGL